MTKYHVGIDLHKTVAQVYVRDHRGEILAESRVGLKDVAEGAAFIERLLEWKDDGRFAVEALGCNRWFVLASRSAGLDVVVVHAAALDLKKSGKKTDKRDAREIARRLYMGDLDRYARSYFASEEEFGRRKLLRIRHRQVQRRQQTVNQVRAILNAYLIRPPKGVLVGKANMAWLRGVELESSDLTFALQVLVDDLENLVGQIARLDTQISLLRENEDVRILESLPQVGIQTAATIHYELGDLGRFGSSREVAAYAGVVPRVSQSGEGKAHHGRITKRGNGELRWILTQWAVRLLAFDPVTRKWAQGLGRKLPKNKLRVALARRLLVGVYMMRTRGEVFSMSRCMGIKAA
ncbi:MAG: IS110 family transposase [bacterium]|nr:IS110 family transposase [bacterium]